MALDEAELLSRLHLHNDYFKKMTDLIPARYYFEQDPKHGMTKAIGKFMHNAKENAPKQQLKDKSSQKKKGTSGKRRRLDPTQQQSVTQIQEGIDRSQLLPGGIASSSAAWREKSEDESESDAMGTGLEDLTDDAVSDNETKSSKQSRLKPISIESVPSSATIDELREKVKKRIEELRTKRKAKAPLSEDVVPKKVARKEAEKEKKKKAEALNAIKASKAQQEALENAAKKKLVNGGLDNGGRNIEGSDSDGEMDRHRTTEDGKTKKRKKKKGKKGGAEEGVSFSQFDFAESEREQAPKKKRKKVTEPRGSHDFGRLLKKAELKQQKMKEMKEKDPDMALEAETEDKWKTVIDKAQGVKVKDDVELIKKSMKRKEQRKKSSKKRWEEREKRVEEKMKQQEIKRRKNIKSKTDSRKSKKVKRLQKKGKLLLQD